jgi:DNA-binding NarL/FixJ family response regulator
MVIRQKSILIIEDETLLSASMKLILEDAGYRIFGIAMTGEDALLMIEQERPDLILMDIKLGGKMDGIAVAKRIIEELRIPVIYVTGNSDDRTMELVKQTKHSGILQKPVEEYELVSIINNVIGN